MHNNLAEPDNNPTDYRKKEGLWFLVILAALIAALFFAICYSKAVGGQAVSYDVVSRLDTKAAGLVSRLREEPCNRELAEAVAGNLLLRAEYAAVITLVNYTEQKCGNEEKLRPVLFFAQKGLSDFSGAKATVDRLMQEHPASPDIYVWRAEVLEARGKWKEAYADLKKGLALFPNPSKVVARVFFDLANLAAKTGQYCEAVAVLQDYVTYDNITRRTPQVMSLISDWQKQGSCAQAFGRGIVHMHYAVNAGEIVMPVEINGIQARMIIDTGASRTLLTHAMAERAGVKTLVGQGAMTHTANGDTWMPGGNVDRISLGNASATHVPVFIQSGKSSSLGEHIDGLLGLSFLGNFKFSVGGGNLELNPLN